MYEPLSFGTDIALCNRLILCGTLCTVRCYVIFICSRYIYRAVPHPILCGTLCTVGCYVANGRHSII